jgi:hypothetical protein
LRTVSERTIVVVAAVEAVVAVEAVEVVKEAEVGVLTTPTIKASPIM